MDIINRYITLLTFLPWIVIYGISIIRNLNNKNYRDFSKNYFKKNFFNIFRIDTLILVVCYFFFASFKMAFVNQYLFAVMCLVLCANSLYDEKKPLEKSFFKKYWGELVLLFLIMLTPFLPYFMRNNLDLTYKIMLVYLFLEYILILFVSLVVKLVKKLFKM